MLSNWRESQIVHDLIEAIPLARGEDRDARICRVAQYMGMSRSGLYNILSEDKTARVPLNALLRLCDMAPERARIEAWRRVSTAIGMRVETTRESEAQHAR